MIGRFGIHLKVKDIEKSLQFYLSFGLKPVFAYGNDVFRSQFDKTLPTAPERYQGVVFEINGAIIEIADGHLAVKKRVFSEPIKSSKVSAMLHTNSIDEIIGICTLNNYDIAVSPKEFPWGTREVVVRDPDGFVLVFIQKLN